MSDTITCPHCGATEGRVIVEASATVEYRQRVQAEVDIALDVNRKDVKHSMGGRVRRYLITPRVDEYLEREEILDTYALMLDPIGNGDEIIAYCAKCNGDITEAWQELLEGRVPLIPESLTRTVLGD